jgi:hypothetical protein
LIPESGNNLPLPIVRPPRLFLYERGSYISWLAALVLVAEGGELRPPSQRSPSGRVRSWLHLPSLVKVGHGNNGYKTVKEFLPEAAE